MYSFLKAFLVLMKLLSLSSSFVWKALWKFCFQHFVGWRDVTGWSRWRY